MSPTADPLAERLRALLPHGVRVVVRREVADDHPGVELVPDPSPTMVPRRRAEFRTGRACAAYAITELGRGPVAVGVGASREPLWPPGVVGSITHTEGLIAAAGAEAGVVAGLGIDAEPARELTDRVAGVIASPRELAAAARAEAPNTVIFGAKEATFKTWFPATGHWLDFADVDLDLTRTTDSGGGFTVRPAAVLIADDERAGAAPWLTTLVGRWVVVGGFVLCGASTPVAPGT